MSEKNIQNRILLALSNAGATVFRNNTAGAWAGDNPSWRGRTLTLENARPLRAGLCTGSSDVIGWQSVEITPEMVGQKVAVFVAVEAKAPRGRVSDAQAVFLARVDEAGGVAVAARSPEEALRALR